MLVALGKIRIVPAAQALRFFSGLTQHGCFKVVVDLRQRLLVPVAIDETATLTDISMEEDGLRYSNIVENKV